MSRCLSDRRLVQISNKLLGENAPLPPERKPRDNTESRMQCSLVDWWHHAHAGLGCPEECFFAVGNGGARSAVTGAIMKREGVRRGTSDLLLLTPRGPYHGMALEMKAPDGVTSPEQRRFLATMTDQGYLARVCYSVESAMSEITLYLSLTDPKRLG